VRNRHPDALRAAVDRELANVTPFDFSARPCITVRALPDPGIRLVTLERFVLFERSLPSGVVIERSFSRNLL
jgi:hypothetical protein